MKPFQSPFLHAISLMMALAQPSRAEVEWKPLSLAQRGRFIELQRGEFVRASSIVKVQGEITLIFSRRDHTGSSRRIFPLSLDGIKELKNADRTALIREINQPEGKIEDFKFLLAVAILVNDHPMELLLIQDEDPFDSWDEREKKLKEAVASLDKLIEIASESEPPAPSAGDKPSK